ncbi:MAG: DUF3854 domain-containing protein, partial [Zavarzinella sp.]|nr:DUF3854 domain-containing protein [Zavarzinella sp.]
MSNTSIPPAGAGGNDPEAIARGRLSEKHLEDLRSSGLSWETIVRGGYRTVGDPKAVGELLKRRDGGKLGACLLFPYFDIDGNPVDGYVRAKPDCPPASRKENGKPAKYLSPTKAPIRPYFPPGVGDLLRDPAQTVAITEGEKKAAVIGQLGVGVVGLAGVECWSKARPRGEDGRAVGRRQLLDDLAGLTWRGRTAYVAFDSDIGQKRDVQRAETSLARALSAAGAVVRLVRIPPADDGSKLGIDDYLVRQPDPATALQALFSQALDYSA